MKKKKITSFNRWDSFAQCSEKFLHWYSENAAELDYWFGGIVPSYTWTFFSWKHCSVIAIIIRFLYLLRTILCLIVSYQYKVWIGRDLEECHDSVDSGPLHMVLCIQLPPPPLSHYLLLCDGWHNTGVISIHYQQKHKEVLLSLIL